jgi:hypothetical protein
VTQHVGDLRLRSIAIDEDGHQLLLQNRPERRDEVGRIRKLNSDDVVWTKAGAGETCGHLIDVAGERGTRSDAARLTIDQRGGPGRGIRKCKETFEHAWGRENRVAVPVRQPVGAQV